MTARISIAVFIAVVSFAWGFWTHGQIVEPQKIEIVKDAEPPVTRTIYVPQTPSEWQKWADSPLVIDRTFDAGLYRIHASDGYKEATVTDRIEVGSSGNWKLYAGIGIVCLVAGGGIVAAAR